MSHLLRRGSGGLGSTCVAEWWMVTNAFEGRPAGRYHGWGRSMAADSNDTAVGRDPDATDDVAPPDVECEAAVAWTARWRARPILALGVRVAALLAPLAAAALATYGLTHTIAEPAWGWWLVGWFALVIGGPSVVLVVATRGARRLLPLAALLRLTLVFP